MKGSSNGTSPQVPSDIQQEKARAEAMLLASLLENPEAWEPVHRILDPARLIPEHQTIHRTLSRMRRDSSALLSPHGVLEEIREAGELETAGGEVYVLEALEAIHHGKDPEDWARLVVAHSERLEFQHILSLAAAQLSESKDTGTVLRGILSHLEEAKGRTWPEKPDLPGPDDPHPLPLDAFPPVLRDWIRSTARSVQVSEDMPALLALVAVSAATAGKAEVDLDAAWIRERLAFYGVMIAEPGERKSPVFSHMFRDLKDWQRERNKEEEGPWEIAQQTLRLTEKRHAKMEEAASKIDATREDLDRAEASLRELLDARKALPRKTELLAQDATPEALVEQMAGQGGRVAVLSPEGGPLQILDGRYSDGVSRLEELAQAYDGEDIHSRRIGRGTTSVRRPTLTLGVALQPSVLDTVRNSRSLRGQGIYGRISWVRPRSLIGNRSDSSDAPPLDERARKMYGDALRRLLDWEPAGVEEDGTPIPHRMTLSREALEAKKAYHKEVEMGMAPGGDLEGIRDWSAKTVGRAVRIAAFLELARRAGENGHLDRLEITGPSMEGGIAVCRALTTHALTVYGEIEADGQLADLRYLLRRLREMPPGTSETELRSATRGRKSIEGAEALRELLDDLEDRGCIRRVYRSAPGPGRPPSPVLELHPDLLHRHTVNTGNSPESPPKVDKRYLRYANAEGEAEEEMEDETAFLAELAGGGS